MEIDQPGVPTQTPRRAEHPHGHAITQVVAKSGRHVDPFDAGLVKIALGGRQLAACHEIRLGVDEKRELDCAEFGKGFSLVGHQRIISRHVDPDLIVAQGSAL